MMGNSSALAACSAGTTIKVRCGLVWTGGGELSNPGAAWSNKTGAPSAPTAFQVNGHGACGLRIFRMLEAMRKTSSALNTVPNIASGKQSTCTSSGSVVVAVLVIIMAIMVLF